MTMILDGSAGVTFPNSTVQASSGVVLQVVNATYSTAVTSSTNTYVDTGLTATITPKFATSKILVIVDQNGCGKNTSDTAVQVAVFRGATKIADIGFVVGYTASTGVGFIGTIGGSILDTPATTSAITYKTQFNSWQNNAAAYVQYQSSTSTITLMEIAG